MPPIIGSIEYAVSASTSGCQARGIGVEALKVIRKLGDLQTSQFKKVEVHHIPNTETANTVAKPWSCTAPKDTPTTAAQQIEGARFRHREEAPYFKQMSDGKTH